VNAPAYQFTADWFSHNAATWNQLLDAGAPSTVLEIGSYEGRSTCFLIEAIGARRPYDIYCVDPWRSSDFDGADMDAVERRFDANVALAREAARNQGSVCKFKGQSSEILPRMLASGRGDKFDMVYIDGSHDAPDVMLDAVLSFYLCRPGGLLIFDDYLWSAEPVGNLDILKTPKPAIDAFINLFRKKLRIIGNVPLYQIYLQRLG
jgi:predicted O-methyltransferase YrrM